MSPFRHLACTLAILLTTLISAPVRGWEVTPTSLTGTESQSVDFDIVIDADEWAPAGTVCNAAVWDFEFQLDGTLVDGTADWGVDLSSPFVGGALTGICSNSEEEVTTPYTISMIEDFTPEDNEDAEIFFEHCEAGRTAEGGEVCTDQTLSITIVEVAGGGLPEVGVFKIDDAAEPDTNGQFSVFSTSPAPDGGVTVRMYISGTASPDSDYVALGGSVFSVFIPEGEDEVLVDVDVIDDALVEGTESVMITVLEDTDYTVSFQFERISILILDDDAEGDVRINQGFSDAWVNFATLGQGFFIIVFPDIKKIFLAWFTYDTQRPPPSVEAILGDPGARWMTAFGDYTGNTAVLDLEFTSGGVFNMLPPDVNQSFDGTITLEFIDCEHGLVHFNIPSLGISGTIPIERLTPDNVALCMEQNDAS